MKRTFALLLILSMLCILASAAAQEAVITKEDAPFSVAFTLPGGARVSELTANDAYSMSSVRFITGYRPAVDIIIAATEKYSGLSFADLSAGEIDKVITDLTAEMTHPVADIRATPDGHEYIVANETDKRNDTSDAVMLVDGYFIMVHVYYDNFGELSDQDVKIAPSIVDTFRFIDSDKS